MRGFLNFIIMILVIFFIITAAVVASNLVGAPSSPGTNGGAPTPQTGTPQAPPAEPPAPPLLIVDSLKFCSALDEGSCITHSTSFTNINRAYVTIAYSQAQVDKAFSIAWYKKAGATESVISGDGEGIIASSGSFTTSLAQTTEGQPLSRGTYVFKMKDEAGAVLKAAEFIVN